MPRRGLGGIGRALLLLRHAKSAWPAGVDDRDRPLAPRGERAADAVGRFLAGADLVPDRVVCSPARRAADTARRALRTAGATTPAITDERLYEGDARPVVAELLPGTRRLLVVGHEPELVALLREVSGAEARLPTAGLAVVELDEGRREPPAADAPTGPRGRLVALVPPRLIDARP